MFSYNIIRDNIIIQNVMDGIIIFSSKGNIISNNDISNNGYQGIYMYVVSDNIISNNIISFNGKDGVHLFDSCVGNQIYNNEIILNDIDGIKFYLHNNHDNNISENLVKYNHWNGIHFMDGYENLVLNNILYSNQWNGIHLGNSDGNHIIANTINNSYNEGIFIFDDSKDNEIYYNNMILNRAIDKGSNIWNNDYLFGGNFWTCYTGYDNNNDGIGDIPFNIPGGNNVDKFPIVNLVSPPNIPEKPSGNIFGVPDKKYSYSCITDDLNNDRIKYGWDWNGDRILDEWTNFYNYSERCYLTHYWAEKGTYIIHVKAIDIRGMESDWSNGLTIYIPKNDIRNIEFLNCIKNNKLFLSLIKFLINRL